VHVANRDQIRQFAGHGGIVATGTLPKPLTSRDVPALQAADFIAWKVRKAHFRMKEWQLSERPLGDRWAQWQHYMDWAKETTREGPVLRKIAGCADFGRTRQVHRLGLSATHYHARS